MPVYLINEGRACAVLSPMKIYKTLKIYIINIMNKNKINVILK